MESITKVKKDELIKELFTLAESGDEETMFRWFSSLNKEYKKQKSAGNINDDVMFELTGFWIEAGQIGGDGMVSWLSSRWTQPPMVIRDIVAFSDKYSEINYKKFEAKMDEIEIAETNSLYNAIIEKNCRTELSAEIYDWDKDDCQSIGLTVPRKRIEGNLYELRYLCAMTVYNRGSMVIRFYARRGQFEIAGIRIYDGIGHWESVDEDEIADAFEDGLQYNEKPVRLIRHDREAADENDKNSNILYIGDRISKNYS